MFFFQLQAKAGGSVFATDPIVVKPGKDCGMTMFQWGIVLGFGFSGAAAMLYQVAWTRTLSMILGTTTFAFTTMLATFLTGIALGSITYGLWPKAISRGKLFVFLPAPGGVFRSFDYPPFREASGSLSFSPWQLGYHLAGDAGAEVYSGRFDHAGSYLRPWCDRCRW